MRLGGAMRVLAVCVCVCVSNRCAHGVPCGRGINGVRNRFRSRSGCACHAVDILEVFFVCYFVGNVAPAALFWGLGSPRTCGVAYDVTELTEMTFFFGEGGHLNFLMNLL